MLKQAELTIQDELLIIRKSSKQPELLTSTPVANSYGHIPTFSVLNRRNRWNDIRQLVISKRPERDQLKETLNVPRNPVKLPHAATLRHMVTPKANENAKPQTTIR